MSFSSNEFACGPDVCVGKTDRVKAAYKSLQQQLNRHGAALKTDGIIGRQTLMAARRALGDEAIAMAEIAEDADTLAAELAKLPVTYPKWGLVLVERSRGSIVPKSVFAQVTGEIPGQVVLRAATGAGAVSSGNLSAAAQSLKGLVDLLVVVTIDTLFAGKAGEFRYWFDGTGSIVGFKTSNGAKVIDQQEKAAVTGVGEAVAEKQARVEVSQRLGAALSAGLKAFRSGGGAGASLPGAGSGGLPAFPGDGTALEQQSIPWGWILGISAVVGVGAFYFASKRTQ